MQVLFLSRWFPYPPDNGSKIRIYNLLKQLALHNDIDLISFASEQVTAERLAEMKRLCRCVETALYQSFQPRRLKALLGVFSWQPRFVVDTHSIELQKLVEQAGRLHSYDVVIASEIDMAAYALALPNVPRMLEELELTTLHEQFLRQRHLFIKLRYGLTWWKTSRYVEHLLHHFSNCTVVSEPERQHLLRISPDARAQIVPNGVEMAYYSGDFGAPQADTLVFSGALTYQANFDAMDFFLCEIWPRVLAERPRAKLSITGKLDGVPVHRLPHREGVVLTGYLDDIRPTVARSWVNVVPLRIGGGTRLKILESLALGTPVVTTRKGVEGLELADGRDLLLADEPADFAAAILRLLRDRELRAALGRQGRQTVEIKYDWHIIGHQWRQLVETIARAR